MEKQKYTFKNCIIAFIISFLSILTVYTVTGIDPFGDRSFLVSDMYSQYSTFLSFFRRTISEGGSFLFTTQMSIGSESFGLLAYYLLSPFNFLTLLFKEEQISTAISLIIALKLSLSAATAAVYFTKKTPNSFKSVALSIVWSLNGYASLYIINIMWLDALICLPLISLGIENSVKKNKSALYIFSLSAAIISNYYIGYMICIFCCLFFIATLLSDIEKANKFALPTLRFALSSLLAGGISAIILIPLALSLKNGKSESPNLYSYIPTFCFILSFAAAIVLFYVCYLKFKSKKKSAYVFGSLGGIFSISTIYFAVISGAKFEFNSLSMLFIGSEHGFDLPSGYPMVYLGVGSVMLAISFFFDNSIRPRRRISLGLMLFFIIISTVIPNLNLIWHAFNQPTWFLYRYSFLIIFILLTAASETCDNKKILLPQTVVISIFAISLFTASDRFSVLFTVLNIAAILLYSAFMYFGKSKLLCIFTIIEVVFAFYTTLNRVTNIWTTDANASKLREHISELSKTIDEIEKYDNSCYRIENLNSRTYNDSLLVGYNGISHYSSALSRQNIQILTNLGFTHTNAWVYYGNGTTNAINSILGVKYILYSPENSIENDKFEVIKNDSALSLAFCTDDLIPNDIEGNIFEKAEYIYSAVLGHEIKIYEYIPSECNAQPCEINIFFESEKEEQFYLWLDIPYYQYGNISINGSESFPCLDTTTHTVIKINAQKGSNNINISSSEQIFISDYALCREDCSKLSEAKSETVELETMINGSTVTIYNPQKYDSNVLLTIPYSGAFEVTADGKEIVATEAANGFISFETNGAEEIIFKYRLPGRKLGLLLTILSLVITALLFCIENDKIRILKDRE